MNFPCTEGLDQAVVDELPWQQVLGVHRRSLGIETFDLEAHELPADAIAESVRAGDHEDAAGLTGDDFAFTTAMTSAARHS